jgi:hypothetical protein
VTPQNQKKLEERIRAAGEAALARRKVVTPIDVLVGIGWLTPAQVEQWRRGQIPCLERVATANLPKLGIALRLLRRWAEGASSPTAGQASSPRGTGDPSTVILTSQDGG